MTKLRSRLRRHFTYANLMASIAVFVALGGVSYAATSINGNKIIKQTVGAGKLKNGTLTSVQVKANALTGNVIEEASLGTVPSAETATSATTATSANTAKSAETAGRASSADDADTLDGFTAQQLQVTCPAETELYGGMCWDDDPRPADDWIAASIDCGEAGGRLPSLSELIAYVFQPGTQVSGQHWSGDASDFDETEGEGVLTRGETTTSFSHSPISLGYRCLFYRVN
jgi:hypothetical protein